MMTFIIGLTGRAGCGKDMGGRALVRELKFTRHAFADPIKKAISAMLNVPVPAWNDREWKEKPLPHIGISPRRLAQTLGTEWGRQLDPNFWVNVLAANVEYFGSPRVVITDVRFDNEAKWIRSQGGWVIEIRREGVEAVEEHSSELGVAPHLIDFALSNEATEAEFQSLLVVAAEGIQKVLAD